MNKNSSESVGHNESDHCGHECGCHRHHHEKVDEHPDFSQCESIVAKLEDSIITYIESSSHLKIEFTPKQMLTVIAHALKEADDPGYSPNYALDLEGVFLSGLYEEIIQHPSNIFEIKAAGKGRVQHLPLSKAIWKETLHRMMFRVESVFTEADPPVSPSTRHPATQSPASTGRFGSINRLFKKS